METVERLFVGAGPAGLRAGQVLAGAGRETLVAEKHAEIGPKTCAGGLTPKTVALLRALGLPDAAGLTHVGQVAFGHGDPVTLDPGSTAVVTLSRRELGRYQSAWTRAAGAEVRADGSDSAVRRALGLPSPRVCFAAEYNLPGVRLEPLRVECDRDLGGGYFWVFPHEGYTSVGAVAPKHVIRPAALRAYLDARLERMRLTEHDVPLEGATLEVDFRGVHFAGGVHLAGDAAGVPSALTAEGIYAALLTGEEVARGIIDPSYPSDRLRRWLRVKRRHDGLAALLRRRSGRAVALPVLDRLSRWRLARRPMAHWFLAG
jgi:geranylgeranyl reductase